MIIINLIGGRAIIKKVSSFCYPRKELGTDSNSLTMVGLQLVPSGVVIVRVKKVSHSCMWNFLHDNSHAHKTGFLPIILRLSCRCRNSWNFDEPYSSTTPLCKRYQRYVCCIIFWRETARIGSWRTSAIWTISKEVSMENVLQNAYPYGGTTA